MPEDWSRFILLTHAGATMAMTGLIWFVQVVHYPLMSHVPAERFGAFERQHQRRTTLVVGPLMLTEAGASAAIVAGWAGRVHPVLAWGGAAALAAIWLMTFAEQVPVHERLGRRFELRDHQRLVRNNWARTIFWTLRGAGALAMLA